MAALTAHRITESGTLAASGAGALDGTYARCTCGHVAKTSLAVSFARQAGERHAAWMNSKVAR